MKYSDSFSRSQLNSVLESKTTVFRSYFHKKGGGGEEFDFPGT